MLERVHEVSQGFQINRGGRNRIGRREKWPKKSREEGEIGGKAGRREKM